MASPTWSLSDDERHTLEQVLDTLLPPSGSFPLPSQTNLIDRFILERVPASDEAANLYPGLDAPRLTSLLHDLAGAADMTAALADLQREQPLTFRSLWSLAVYGYYSCPETIDAIQRDLAPDYHGAPLPLGYTGAMPPWDATDALQMPRNPRGSFVPTERVERADLSKLADERSRN